MDLLEQSYRENEMLRERLSRLSEASLRINESLDFDQVLQGVLDSARSLTGARYGVMTLMDDTGQVQDFLSSGLTAEESGKLWLMPEGLGIFQALIGISKPMRVPDLVQHVQNLGFTDFSIPLPVGVFSFLASPMFHRGARVGQVFVGYKDDGREEFTQEDEETLVMFCFPGCSGHRQRATAPGGAARTGGSGDVGEHLAGGRRCAGYRDGSSSVGQPGSHAHSGRPAGGRADG